MKKYAVNTDRELYRLTARGDEAAFSELVKRYESLVFTVAYGVLHDRDDAADAAQEAFLKLWRGAAGWRGECEVKSWIYRIAKTSALDAARSRSARFSVSFEDTFSEAEDTAPTPEEETERRDTAEIVRRAVASLPETHREVIELREFAGLSYREIAETAGVDIGTVKSRLSRARAELYEILKDKIGDDGTKGRTPPSKEQTLR